MQEDYKVPPFPDNPTMAQTRNNKDRRTRKAKAKACLFVAVSTIIFRRAMSLEIAKAIWDYPKDEDAGDERMHRM